VCLQTDVGVDMYPKVTNRGYWRHISTAECRYLLARSGSDAVVDQKHTKAVQSLIGSPSAGWPALQDDTSSKQADTLSARPLTSLG